MSILLELYAAVFGVEFSLSTVTLQILQKLLADVEDSAACKEKLLQMLRSGTLDDELIANPVPTILCIAHVVLALADKYLDHTAHSTGLSQVIADDEDAPMIAEYAAALDVKVPMGGVLTDLVVKMIVTKLLEELKKYLQG